MIMEESREKGISSIGDLLGGMLGGMTDLLRSVLSLDLLGGIVKPMVKIAMSLMSPVFELVSRLVGAVINMLAPPLLEAVGSLLGAVGPIVESLTGMFGSSD